MANFPLKLGRKMSDSMMPSTKVDVADKDEMHYPSIYLEWDDKYDLPDEGTMVIKFKKNSETNRKTKDKETQEVSLDVLEITSVKGSGGSKEEKSTGDHLDKLRKEVEAEGDSADDKESPAEDEGEY